MSEDEFKRDVREVISSSGLSYQDIAAAVRVHVATIYRWSNGTATPSAYAYILLKELCEKKGRQ